VGEVLTCKLELGTVHLNKLVYAIKEEDEVWSKILAIVDVGPSRHLKLRGLDIRSNNLAIYLFTVLCLEQQCRLSYKAMLKE
jgi:hypothetical protein